MVLVVAVVEVATNTHIQFTYELHTQLLWELYKYYLSLVQQNTNGCGCYPYPHSFLLYCIRIKTRSQNANYAKRAGREGVSPIQRVCVYFCGHGT